MSKYVERLTAPATADKNWIHYSKGGYNYCILISGSSCLPNCVGYAWGRWRELLGAHHKLSRGNAENWYLNAGDGYKRGRTPKVGAVICWAKGVAGYGADGAGHVAIVERVNADGSIVISQSGYGYKRFWTQTLKAPYNIGSGYTFQGFIYLPIEFDTNTTPIVNNVNNSLKVGDKVKLVPNATYYSGNKIPRWVFEKVLYVREINGNRVVISTLASGAITGAVKKEFLKKV